MSEVSVSILSIPKDNTVSMFYNLETAKVDYFHIDVMDGKFVEKNTLEFMKESALTLSHISNIGLDVHFMVEKVEEFIDEYLDLEPKIMTFHYEVIKEKNRMLEMINEIKRNDIQVGIAINPETEIDCIKEFLPYIHQVLVMMVVPGKGGQKLIPETLQKIKDLKQYIINNNLEIDLEADGGINNETAEAVRNAGCDRLVSGSYITGSENYAEAVKIIKGI